MTVKRWALCLGLLLLAAPALADDVVYGGADLWITAGGESGTMTKFKYDPIPRDFFCQGSPSFNGTIAFRGEPLTTAPAGVLGNVDTIVHRLDDAEFDEDGTATTRIQLMALSLVGIEPYDFGCEQPYNVAVSLDGEQPTTEMKIFREKTDGGTYVAPLALKVKVTFTPVGGGEAKIVHREIELGPGMNSFWSTTERVGHTIDGKPVQVDTDGDRVADASMPQATNFNPNLAPRWMVVPAATKSPSPVPYPNPCPDANQCPVEACHCNPDSEDPEEPGENCNPDHLHCRWVCVYCSGGVNPASSGP